MSNCVLCPSQLSQDPFTSIKTVGLGTVEDTGMQRENHRSEAVELKKTFTHY